MAYLSATWPMNLDDEASAERCGRLFAALGCAGVQAFWRGEAKFDLDAEAERVRRFGLAFDSVHGAFGPHIDPSSPDHETRARTIHTHERDGEIARALGGPRVVVHPAAKIPDEARRGAFDPRRRAAWG